MNKNTFSASHTTTVQPNAVLALANGHVFTGYAIGALDKISTGEVIFNTAMTGYQEILTDPSYYRQIIVFTAPHIGNTGINDEDIESAAIHCAGIVIHQLPHRASNWRQQKGLTDYLCQHGIVAIAGVDTRQLTRLLRDEGAQGGTIAMLGYEGERDLSTLTKRASSKARTFGSMSGKALAYEVSTKSVYDWYQSDWTLSGYQSTSPDQTLSALSRPSVTLDSSTNEVAANVLAHTSLLPRVAVLDFGVKYNILRRLVSHQCQVSVFPATTTLSDLLASQPDGILLTNGPGDPEPCIEAISLIKSLLNIHQIPIFGICLGHQLLGLACGAKTIKMKLGHHGANHPVLDVNRNRVMITSQNHGFAIDEDNLPSELFITHRSLFDGTVQGFMHRTLPAFGFQGHPEASPGPQDIDILFKQFVSIMSRSVSKSASQ